MTRPAWFLIAPALLVSLVAAPSEAARHHPASHPKLEPTQKVVVKKTPTSHRAHRRHRSLKSRSHAQR